MLCESSLVPRPFVGAKMGLFAHAYKFPYSENIQNKNPKQYTKSMCSGLFTRERSSAVMAALLCRVCLSDI